MLKNTCSPEQAAARINIELERAAFEKWYGLDSTTAHLDVCKLTGWSPEKTKAWEVWLARAQQGAPVAAAPYPNPDTQPEPRTAHDYDLVHALGLGASPPSIDPRDIPADTGHAGVDQLIGRLCSADPDFEDCTSAALVIRALTTLLLAGGPVSRASDREVSLPQMPTIDIGGSLKPQIWFSAKETLAYAEAAVQADRKAAAGEATAPGGVVPLLPLPEPVDELALADGFNVVGTQDVFTGDQMRVYALANRRLSAGSAPAAALQLLGPEHRGMRVGYHGLFSQARNALRREGGIAEMLRQLEEHLTELGTRWYAGDVQVVDELLQLYSIEREARQALVAQGSSNG